ncbi:MAG: hypothetical protein QXN87_05955, partial [Candidatus Bathyarchaeia archaeon]
QDCPFQYLLDWQRYLFPCWRKSYETLSNLGQDKPSIIYVHLNDLTVLKLLRLADNTFHND